MPPKPASKAPTHQVTAQTTIMSDTEVAIFRNVPPRYHNPARTEYDLRTSNKDFVSAGWSDIGAVLTPNNLELRILTDYIPSLTLHDWRPLHVTISHSISSTCKILECVLPFDTPMPIVAPRSVNKNFRLDFPSSFAKHVFSHDDQITFTWGKLLKCRKGERQ